MKVRRPSSANSSKSSVNAALVLAGSIASLLAMAASQAANTVNNYTGSTTGNFQTTTNWSLGTVPLVTEDAIFPLVAATGIRTLSSGAITVGSLNVLATTGTFSLRNEAVDATSSALILGGVGNLGNSVSGRATDLLFVNAGATLNLLGANGGVGTGVLGVALGQTGSFNIAGTTEISAVISGTGFGFTKTGVGTLTLKPTSVNTYTGPTSVTGGTLTLDNTAITAANPTNLIDSGSALSLGGGTLSILGKPGGATSQTVAGTTFNAAANVITINRNAGTSATLAMGALTRNTGGVINFRPTATWAAGVASTMEIVTTTGINGGALPGATSFIGAWATQGVGAGTVYVQLNPSGQFVAAPNFTLLTAATAANMTSATTGYTWTSGSFTLGGNLTAYALLRTGTGASTFTIGANTLTMNGIIQAGAGASGIGTTFSAATGAGGIVVGVENELVLNAAAGGIAVNAPISNQPANASHVTITGNTTAANVVMGAQHLYTGGTTLSGANTTAAATVSSVGPAGNPTSGPFGAGTAPLILAGGQIRGTIGSATTIGNVVTISNDTTFPTVATEKSLIFSGPVTLTGANRILTGNLGTTVTTEAAIFSGAIGDAGNGLGIIKAGTGTIRLSGANTYTGPTLVSAGTLQIGDAGTTGSLSPGSALTTNATLVFNRTDTLTQGTDFASVIAGTGTITQAGTGTTVLNGTNTFTGNVTIAAGAIQITNSAALGTGTKTVTINANVNKSLDLDGSGGDITLASGISFQTSGVNGVIKNIAGNNTINGAFTMSAVNGNTKIISNGGTLTLAGNFTSSSTLRVLDLGGSSTGANTFSGSLDNVNVPALAKTDAGTWILSGASTYTGTTTVTDGTLKAGSLTGFSATSAFTTANTATAILDLNGFNSSVGSLAGGGVTGGDVALGASTLTAGGNGSSTTYAGILGGTGGGLTKVGGGTMTLTGPNSYTGTTTVTSGALIVDNTLASATVNVGATGTLGGVGPLAGTVNATGMLSPATATTAGTLTIGTLTLNAGSSLAYEFGGTSDLVSVTAANGLTISGGALSLFAAGGVTPLTTDGTYPLFNYNTGILGSIANLTVANPQLNKFYQVNDTLAGAITITLTTTTTSDWNGAALNGLWTTVGNWTAGTPNSPGSVATLGTIPVAPTSIAVDGAKVIGSLLFDNANAYTVTGGVADTLTFDNGIAAGIVNVANGSHTVSAPVVLGSNLSVTPAAATSLTLSGLVSGAKGLTKNGNGTLTLSGANTFTGPVTVSEGALSVASVADGGSPSNLGQSPSAAGNLILDGGTLQYTGASGATNRNFTITSGKTGTIEVTAGATILTLSGASASTTGALTKSGPGKLILTGANAHAGLTTVSTGVLNIQNAAALGTTTTGTSVTAGAALEIQGGITVGAEALTLNGDGIASAGALRSVSGVNAFGGLLTLGSAARIHTDADSLTLSHPGTITGATFGLTVGGAGNTTIDSIIGTTTGTLTKEGGGALTLTAANTFTGATLISAGTLQIGNGGATGSLSSSSSITNNATLAFNRTNTITQGTGFASVISGTGGVTQSGAGTLILSGANDYTGPTLISAGTLQIGNAGTTGSLSPSSTITNNATLAFSRTDTVTQGTDFASVISGTGAVTLNSGILVLNGANTYDGLTSVATGAVVTLAVGGTLGSTVGGTTVANNGRLELDGGISVTGEALTISGTGGAGFFIGALNGKTGSNTWTGPVTIAANLTRIGALAGATMTVSGAIGSGANVFGVIFRPADATASVVVTGPNTYLGVTQIVGGPVSVLSINSVVGGSPTSSLGAPSTVAAGTIALGATTVGGTLVYTGVGETTDRVVNLAGTTVGGGIDQSGSGLLKFTSNFTATGTGAKTLTLQGSNLAGTGEIAGVIVDSTAATSVSKLGTGQWTLSGLNTYTGKTTIGNGTLSVNTVNVSATADQALGKNAALDLGVAATSSGTLVYTGGADTLAKTINVLGNGSNTIQNSGGGLLTLSGAITKSGTTLVLKGGANGIDVTGAIGGAVANSDLIIDGGTTTLSNANTYNGPTSIINGATLEISGSLTATTSVSVTSGKLLLSGTSEIINNAATLSLGTGSTLAFGTGLSGRSETFDSLTLLDHAILDFGDGDTNKFAFTNGISGLSTFTLSIHNWSGPAGAGTQDILALSNVLGATELGNISFYSDGGGAFLGNGNQISFAVPAFEIVPVPEPSSTALLGAAGLLALVRFRERRRGMKLRA